MLICRPILDNVGITDSAAQVALLAGLNMYGFVVLMFVATCVVERQVYVDAHHSPTDMVVERYGCGVFGLQTPCFTISTALSVSNSLADNGQLTRKGVYEATQNSAIGVATIPVIYLYFGFYVACWSTVAPMCKCHEVLCSSCQMPPKSCQLCFDPKGLPSIPRSSR